MLNNKETLIKTLLYRSMHRGCKETDILLGKFVKNQINTFGDKELSLYSELILEDDAMIYDWILYKTLVPNKYQNLVKNIRQFHSL